MNELAEWASQPQNLASSLATAERAASARLVAAFSGDTDIAELVQARAWVVEQLVLTAWKALMPAYPDIELVAVGGFGRGEMHPHSDVDLLILIPESLDEVNGSSKPPPGETSLQKLERFIRALWDTGLHPGHSVRTVPECVAQAQSDVTVATNLMESRLLHGPGILFEKTRAAIGPDSIWAADQFFAAKYAEQQQRHDRFEDTVYNLEPDIKSGPGGLRDIQMIGWVARRHFGTSTFFGLVEHGFLTEREHDQLTAARKRLWSIRWALHQLADRSEERLLFDYQRTLATHFGFVQEDSNIAVELFMQHYYRTAMLVERLNEQLLQMFEEELLVGRKHLPSACIDQDFRLHHGYLEVVDEQAFVRKPELLLKIFLILSNHSEVRGVRASTIRLIRDHLYLIDEDFRNNRHYLDLFLQLLKKKKRIYPQLQRMNHYGVLAALIPEFAQVAGRMQFDLFHVYTVDQHILFVIRNLRRIVRNTIPDQFARPSQIGKRIEQQEVLYLAALFHDIAKGRGGDHSELGAADARSLMGRLDLEPDARDLVVWLVEQHLLMSMTAQRQDISDPAVVDEFVEKVGSQQRLEHLYVLTAADIAATRPKLWNAWKDSLLWQLFNSASERLAEGLNEPIDQNELCVQRCAEAQWLLMGSGDPEDVSNDCLNALWSSLSPQALTRMDADQLGWSSGSILNLYIDQDWHIAVSRRLDEKDITELLVYGPDFKGLFAIIAHEFDHMRINVLSARIATTAEKRVWNIFQIVDAHGQPLHRSDAERLEQAIVRQLAKQDIRPLVNRSIPRRLRLFIRRSEIHFDTRTTESGVKTRLEIHTTDRPGLLSMVANAMLKADVRLFDARVATFGQRVEDVFLIGNASANMLGADQQAALESALRELLDIDIA